jgi:hypothetical protein
MLKTAIDKAFAMVKQTKETMNSDWTTDKDLLNLYEWLYGDEDIQDEPSKESQMSKASFQSFSPT